MQFISDKQWLAGIRDIIELHKYGRADEVRTVHRLASTREERYQKALEYLEGKRGQQGKPAGARGGEEGGQQGKPAGASGGKKERGQQGEPAGAREGRRTAGGTCWSKGRKEDGRGNLLEQGNEGGQQGKPAGAREGRRTAGGTCWSKQGGRKERGRQGEPAGASGRKERGEQGDLVFTTVGSAEGGHARKYSNKFGISLTYP